MLGLRKVDTPINVMWRTKIVVPRPELVGMARMSPLGPIGNRTFQEEPNRTECYEPDKIAIPQSMKRA